MQLFQLNFHMKTIEEHMCYVIRPIYLADKQTSWDLNL